MKIEYFKPKDIPFELLTKEIALDIINRTKGKNKGQQNYRNELLSTISSDPDMELYDRVQDVFHNIADECHDGAYEKSSCTEPFNDYDIENYNAMLPIVWWESTDDMPA